MPKAKLKNCCCSALHFYKLHPASPRWFTDKLQRILNAASHVISNTGKFDHGVRQLLHGKLYRLDVRDRVTFKLVVMVHRCLNNQAPQYLAVHCVPLSSQRHLCSVEWNLLHDTTSPTTRMDARLFTLLVCLPETIFRIRTPLKLLSGAC